MGSRGPAGKTPKEQRLAGNPGHRKLASGSKIPAGKPVCPGWLSTAAKKEFRRVVRELGALDLLTRVDADVVSLYAETFASWRAAVETLRREGSTYTAGSGLKKSHPAVAIEAATSARLLALLKEIANTPLARRRLGLNAPERALDKEANAKQRFFQPE